MRKVLLYISCCLSFLAILVSVSGCAITDTNSDKINDVEYSVITTNELPSEVAELIEKNEKKKMQFTYTDQGITYIIRGYGSQPTSGYSIEVMDLYETETTICIVTNLLGPGKNEEIKTVETYPYIVIRIKENKKPIMFEGAK